MNTQIGNRDKRIALLLVAAFAWLFIGSLVVFHQEHVLGKHFRMNTHLFISPKLKDKENYSVALQKSLLKFQETGQMTGIVPGDHAQPGLISYSFSAYKDTFVFRRLHDIVVTNAPLRAPPVTC